MEIDHIILLPKTFQWLSIHLKYSGNLTISCKAHLASSTAQPPFLLLFHLSYYTSITLAFWASSTCQSIAYLRAFSSAFPSLWNFTLPFFICGLHQVKEVFLVLRNNWWELLVVMVARLGWGGMQVICRGRSRSELCSEEAAQGSLKNSHISPVREPAFDRLPLRGP